jgi:hypothetical protein
MTDSTDIQAPYEKIAAMSEADLFRFIVEILDYETAYIRQIQPIYKELYGHPEWAPMAARRHHVLCAFSNLLGKWISAVEKQPVPFLTRDADILRERILAEMKQLDPTLGGKS